MFQGRSAAPGGQNDARLIYAYIFRINNFVVFPMFQYTILMDPGRVSESVSANDGFIWLDRHIHQRRYLTIELWDSADQRQLAFSEQKTEGDELNSMMANWTDSITEVGIFRVMAEATVRPHGKTRRTKARKPHRRQRRANR